ncbi:MAG: hypothetical protein QOG73_4149 [Acetobacteraceae bacterium]|jgi:hypothetical protein|nr:hypothetical protein [Acetobacteraceae bacterium]
MTPGHDGLPGWGEKGQSYAVAIRRAVAEGCIRPETATVFLKETG